MALACDEDRAARVADRFNGVDEFVLRAFLRAGQVLEIVEHEQADVPESCLKLSNPPVSKRCKVAVRKLFGA